MRVTAISRQVKRQDRYSVYLDEKFAFGLSESGLLKSGLYVGKELSQEEAADLAAHVQTDKALTAAINYLSYRSRSEWEMHDYLRRRKEIAPEVVDDVVAHLSDQGLLNDAQFAHNWVANRRLLKPTSNRKLRQELMQKHINDSHITAALEEDADEEQALRAMIVKKRSKYPDQAKLMQYLARQGFGYDAIKNALAHEPE
ncbi:MAG TPA: RecX family transcriptional regulator [Candidatus Saccharimonadales bacterium]|nr:RecX family transcriptional regulator [Candidatus Saccharimonadales bacterium]